MIGFLEGLVVTLKSALRRPVTAQYPEPAERLVIADRFMGFPALTWDFDVAEPYCTGCMVCIRDCPTQCMTATMKDNPLHAEEKSRRRKIIDEFEINLGRCILCGICVDVCNFDAIEMSHEHERSKYERDGNRVDLPQLLKMGTEYQAETEWKPKQPAKNSGVPVKKEARPEQGGGGQAEPREPAARKPAAEGSVGKSDQAQSQDPAARKAAAEGPVDKSDQTRPQDE